MKKKDTQNIKTFIEMLQNDLRTCFVDVTNPEEMYKKEDDIKALENIVIAIKTLVKNNGNLMLLQYMPDLIKNQIEEEYKRKKK